MQNVHLFEHNGMDNKAAIKNVEGIIKLVRDSL